LTRQNPVIFIDGQILRTVLGFIGVILVRRQHLSRLFGIKIHRA